jgi:hypothetical protein
VTLPSLGAGAHIALIDRGTLPQLRDVWNVDLDEMARRLERGEECYGGWLDGRLAHYSWVQSSGVHDVTDANRRVEVQPRELWIYHCRTASWARGRNLYPSALGTILHDATRKARTRAWIYTTKDNVPSQRGIVRAGFVMDRTMRSIALGPLVIPVPWAR